MQATNTILGGFSLNQPGFVNPEAAVSAKTDMTNTENRWFIAEVVVRFDITDDDEWFFHINATLISAPSVDAAYEKALHFGTLEDMEYTNTDDKLVKSHFEGLRELLDVGETLGEGTELYYEELSLPGGSELGNIIKPQAELAAFNGRLQSQPSGRPPRMGSGL